MVATRTMGTSPASPAAPSLVQEMSPLWFLGNMVGLLSLYFELMLAPGKSVLHKDSKANSVNSKGDMFVYHTLPELSSVTPNTVDKLFDISICF